MISKEAFDIFNHITDTFEKVGDAIERLALEVTEIKKDIENLDYRARNTKEKLDFLWNLEKERLSGEEEVPA